MKPASSVNTNHATDRMKLNLIKTAGIIDAAFTLKLAWIKSRNIGITDEEAQLRVYTDILERKERQWMFHTGS